MKDLPRRHVMGAPVGCLNDVKRTALTSTLEHKAIAMQTDGLFATIYQAPAHQRIAGPEPTSGRGQFIYIASGAAKFDGQTHEAGTAIFIAPTDPAATLTTDISGAEILVMQFPRASS
jgi:redox-sensitive bicupin YhaK (pirin superfamily)